MIKVILDIKKIDKLDLNGISFKTSENSERSEHSCIARLTTEEFVKFIGLNGMTLKHNGTFIALLDKNDDFKYGEVEL